MKMTVWELTRLVALMGLVVGSLAPRVEARTYRVWSDAELMAKADVVVMADPISSKDVVETPPNQKEWQKDWQGVETTFAVEVILKGDIGRAVPVRSPRDQELNPAPTIVLHHYRYADTKGLIVNGFRFARFDEKKHKVLLYLKKTPTGSYEPVTGQGDAVDSVRVISKYPEYGHRTSAEKKAIKELEKK